MSGRWFWPLASAALAAALFWQIRTGAQRLEAARLVWQVERLGRAVLAGERAPATLRPGLVMLRRARQLDPSSVEVVATRGDLYLLLGRLEAAREAYGEALELEPRAEVYANLGHTLQRLGEQEQARDAFRTAIVLDPALAASLPQDARR